jgi:dTDP-L-rhamnose 4-epimerase
MDLLINSEHQVKKIILASSRAIYGEGKYVNKNGLICYPEPRKNSDMENGRFDLFDPLTDEPLKMLPSDEASKMHPSSVYGLTKQAQEQLIMLMGKQLKIAAVSLRFQNVYGPGQSLANPYTGLLAVFSNRIRNNKPLDIYEDGKESRDFVYIEDAIDSIVLSLEKPAANDQIFNVGNGTPIPISRVAELMCQYFDIQVPIEISGKFRPGDIRHNCAELEKVRSLLGFEPKVNFEAGLKKLIEWVQRENILEDKYDRSIAEIRAKGLMH